MENRNNFLPSSSSLVLDPPIPIPHLNYQNPMLTTFTEMLQWDPSSFSSFYQTDNYVMNISQNQPMRIDNGFTSSKSKMDAVIIIENYVDGYLTNFVDPNNADSSSIQTIVNQNFEAGSMEFSEFDFTNFEDVEITGHSNSDHKTTSQFEYTGLLSNVVNNCYSVANNNWNLAATKFPSTELSPPPWNRVVAETNDKAKSPKFKWSVNEHNLFLVGMTIFGKGDWQNIAYKVVITKTHKQVASHAQKFFLRQQVPIEKRKKSSIHDIVNVDHALLLHVCAHLGVGLPSPSLPLLNFPPPPDAS